MNISKMQRRLAILYVFVLRLETSSDKLDQNLEHITPYSMARILWVSPQYCNRLMRGLVQDGFLTRVECQSDTKALSYEYDITPEGIAHMDALHFMAQQAVDTVLESKRSQIRFLSWA